MLVDGCADGGDPVLSGNTGGYTFLRLDGHGEGCAVFAGVVADHHRQLKAADVLIGQAEADNAAAFADEQGHLFGGQVFGGENEIAFVFPVFIIDQKNAMPATEGGQGCFYAVLGIAEAG